MAVDGYVQVPPDSTGAKIDAASVGVAGNVVMRQRIVIGDNSASAQFALVTGGALLVQPNAVAISGTPSVVLAAGTANFGTLNNISRSVEVVISGPLPAIAISGTPSVVLAAGTANFGTLNNISRTVEVTISTPFTINNISATVNVSGTFTIGTIDRISATATVAISNFVDSSGNNRNVVDSVNTALRVNIVAGAASGVSQIDDTSFSTGAATFAPIGAVFSDTGTGQSLSASHAGALRMTGFRALHTNLRNSAGAEMGTPTSPLSVKVENQSATVLVLGVVQINSAAAPVIVNNISATVNVVLGAGAANIGTINGISQTVSVIVAGFRDNSGDVKALIDSTNIALRVQGYGTLGGLPNTGFVDASGQNRIVVDSANLALRVTIANATATVAITCATPFTLNNISRTVAITCSTPFTIDGISATVTVTTANPYVLNVPSASHGPRMVQVSTSATATFLAAPGAGLHIYITSLAVSNAGTNLTGCQIGPSATLGLVTMVAAANGGGFVMNYDPPIKIFSNEALLCRCDPNPGGNCFFNVNFYVAA